MWSAWFRSGCGRMAVVARHVGIKRVGLGNLHIEGLGGPADAELDSAEGSRLDGRGPDGVRFSLERAFPDGRK